MFVCFLLLPFNWWILSFQMHKICVACFYTSRNISRLSQNQTTNWFFRIFFKYKIQFAYTFFVRFFFLISVEFLGWVNNFEQPEKIHHFIIQTKSFGKCNFYLINIIFHVSVLPELPYDCKMYLISYACLLLGFQTNSNFFYFIFLVKNINYFVPNQLFFLCFQTKIVQLDNARVKLQVLLSKIH